VSAALALRAPLRNPAAGAFAALVFVVILDALVTPHFISAATLWNVGLQISTTVLVATGMTIVVATGGIDLSVGSVMAVASAVAAMLLPIGVGTAIAGGVGVALVIGLTNGLLVARLRVLPIIVTLAMLIIGRGAGQVIVAGSPLVTFTSPRFEYLGKGHLGPVPVPVLITAVVAVLLLLVVHATTFGRYVVAIGGNERAAALAGVPIARVKVLAYVLSSALAGVAGLVVAARLGATDPGTIGQGTELDAIAATVVGGSTLAGGRASIGGTVVGSLLMGVLTASFAMHLVPYAWGLVVKALILVVAVYLQRPKGD
jgi:ribose/xylose/arabinose/galactoside ABC-type transport system permease subunit